MIFYTSCSCLLLNEWRRLTSVHVCITKVDRRKHAKSSITDDALRNPMIWKANALDVNEMVKYMRLMLNTAGLFREYLQASEEPARLAWSYFLDAHYTCVWCQTVEWNWLCDLWLIDDWLRIVLSNAVNDRRDGFNFPITKKPWKSRECYRDCVSGVVVFCSYA